MALGKIHHDVTFLSGVFCHLRLLVVFGPFLVGRLYGRTGRLQVDASGMLRGHPASLAWPLLRDADGAARRDVKSGHGLVPLALRCYPCWLVKNQKQALTKRKTEPFLGRSSHFDTYPTEGETALPEGFEEIGGEGLFGCLLSCWWLGTGLVLRLRSWFHFFRLHPARVFEP